MRERTEKLAKQELARAISRRSSTEADLRVADASIEQAHNEQRSATASSPAVSATELLAHQAFLERIEAQRAQHAHELTQREADVVDRDAELATAASEHEALNRLRERRHGEHVRALALQEQGALDEIAISRFGRGAA